MNERMNTNVKNQDYVKSAQENFKARCPKNMEFEGDISSGDLIQTRSWISFKRIQKEFYKYGRIKT